MSIKDKFKKAVDWAFFNNGNKVDYTRLRIDDATPLHTTGFNWLKYNFRASAIVVTLGASGPISSFDPEFMKGVAVSLLYGVGFNEIFTRCFLRMELGDKCFRKKESGLETSPDDLSVADRNRDWSTVFAAVAFPIFVDSLCKSIDQCTIYNAAYFLISLPVVLDGFVKAYQFNKVIEGEWVIEDSPPPEKVPEKERSPSRSWLPGLSEPPPPQVAPA